jgi:hypothetical protein
VLFYITKRVGGGVQDFNAIKVLKFAVSWMIRAYKVPPLRQIIGAPFERQKLRQALDGM